MDELDKRLRAVETDLAALSERMKTVEALTASVRDMVAEMKYIRSDLCRLSDDVGEIKKRPAGLWDRLVSALIGALVSAAVSAFSGR